MHKILYTLAFTTAFGLGIVFGNPAWGQATCVQRSEALAHLDKKYGEVQVAIGVTNKGGLVEVLTSADGATWTIIVTTPDGTSCLVASGEGWRTKPRDDSKLAPGV